MNERELRVALLYIIYGVEIYEAIEDARETPFLNKICEPFGKGTAGEQRPDKEGKRGGRH
jgi:hypothetical protein